MAKEAKTTSEACFMSGKQLYETRKSRDILTLSLSSDIAFNGGIPLGCTTIFGGAPKLGKTTTVLQYAANGQKQFKSKVFFFGPEGRLSNQTMDQVKDLNLDNMTVVLGPPIMDKEGNIAGHKKMAAEKWWDEIGKCITQNPGAIIIVDSISALCNEAELAEGSGYQGRGALQKLEAQFCRQYADLVMPNNVTLLLLAQVQANTSGYGDPMQIKAGNSIKHASDCTVFIRSAEKWTPDSSGRILGHDMKWKILCSPLGPPFMECNVPLRFGHGIDLVQDVINHAMNWNLIEGKGAWYNIPFDANGKFLEKAEGIKLQGEANIWAWFKANPKALIELEKWIRNKIWPS